MPSKSEARSPRKRVNPPELPVPEAQSPNIVALQPEDGRPQNEHTGWSTASESDKSSRFSSSLETLNDVAIPVAPSPAKGKAPQIPGLEAGEDPLDPNNVRSRRTRILIGMLSYAWIFHFAIIGGMTYVLGYLIPQNYLDGVVWNTGCWWKIGWLLPLPYTLMCFIGLALPLPNPKYKNVDKKDARRIDNLYILTVTKGDNREAVMRAWHAHRHLEGLDPCVRVHVLTDEPNHFEGINCYTCPKSFTTEHSKYKARALEWYRQTVRYTEHDWVLHLDEESVIDAEGVRRCLDFIRYEKEYHWGQGVIIYNQYRFWKNPIFTVADAIRVGDDLSRFHLQYSYFHRPIFGAHGSFLLTNGLVENAITWDLGSLTEDFQFAVAAWRNGFKCGSIPAIVREQSPLDFIGFLKQRRRWFVGIRRLPSVFPKLLAFFWALGLLSLYCTVASIILGVYVPFDTPRWFGVVKDFSFITFIYLYALGMFVQNVDYGFNPIVVILLIPVTVVFQFVAVLMEALAVMYGIILPPDDFDVIKK
ncbi:glycosyl transferase family group 2-domain-containing protein [Gaertneriomyces semiglobifer]|nr:glycosyl transferase family group 2-domain-containing protein [Gaertneriomyces semiglobifer]